MKVSELNLVENHVIEQLHKEGYMETEGKSEQELKQTLAKIRAMKVKIESDSNHYF
ncbi:hypothetical protein [Ornithinibacillus sp. JPR2-1]|uniref:hypothetical protein n=1 Tax=Ornithinibacillus sp. JPR2-1 TaxID=2094019 RepID=UPI0031DCDDF5